MSLVFDELVKLETSLWQPETRNDRGYLERILHPDFFEFGRSGKVWTRVETLEPGGQFTASLSNFTAHEVSDGVVLLTYVSAFGATDAQYANRSSIWLHAEGRWLLRFHQGTPCSR